MALTIVVRSAGGAQRGPTPEETEQRGLAIVFDAPRLVVGRGEGADLRLPDPSVSHRHASIRQRGAEYVLLDEGSTNGTFVGEVKLPPQSPRIVRGGELVRVGRVWLELVIGPAVPAKQPAAAAKELALELVMRGLAAQGEDARPRVLAVEGPDAGKELVLSDAGRRYVIGRGKDADLVLDDADASRRHVDVARRGEHLVVQDLGSKGGASLDGEPLGQGDTPWRAGQRLAVGANIFALELPAALALAELERSPDEAMARSEVVAVPGEPAPKETPEPTPAAPSAELAARDEAGTEPAPRRAAAGGWNVTDAAVLLLAAGVLLLSVAGLAWLLHR